MKKVKVRKSKVRGTGMFPMKSDYDKEKVPRKSGRLKNKSQYYDEE